MDITAGRKIASIGQYNYSMNVFGINQRAKPVSEFCITVKGKGVFALGPVMSDAGNPIFDIAFKVLRRKKCHSLSCFRVAVSNKVMRCSASSLVTFLKSSSIQIS